MTDHEIVKAIHKIMSGNEWSSDTLDAIANILNNNGYIVPDIEDAAPDSVMLAIEDETDPLPDAVASAWDVYLDPPEK